jgi:hypothetical protein
MGKEWFHMQGRLKTYGRRRVIDAFEASMKATERLNPEDKDQVTVTGQFVKLLHAAMAKDDALTRAIRRDLGIDHPPPVQRTRRPAGEGRETMGGPEPDKEGTDLLGEPEPDEEGIDLMGGRPPGT